MNNAVVIFCWYGKLVGMYCFWHDTQMQMYVEKSLSVNLKE